MSIQYEKPSLGSQTYQKSVYQTLLFAYRPHMLRTIFCIGLGFIGRICLLANANIIGYWVDSICQSSNLMNECKPAPSYFANFSSQNYISLLLGLVILGFSFILIFRVVFSRMSAKAVSQIYDETTYRTSRQPLSFFDSTPAGRIITRFSSDYGNVFRLFGGPLAELLSIVFDLIAMLFLITLANPIYLPIVLLMGVVDFGIYKLNANRIRAARRSVSASRSPSIAHFAETAQGASAIRTFSKQATFTDRFRFLDNHYLINKLNTTKIIFSFSFQINFATASFLLLTGIVAIALLNQNMLSIGSIGVAFGFLTLSGGTIQMFFEWISQFEEAMVGIERMDQFLRQPVESGAKIPAEAKFPTGHPQRSHQEQENLRHLKLTSAESAVVDFSDVWLRYRADSQPVLKGVSFQVKAGERFGIVGRTGSGKSSLIQALFYLYPIEKGCIAIDHKSPQDEHIDLQLYRKSISLISQDPTLFRGKLRENVDISSAKSDEEIFEVLKKVGLEEWANPTSLQKSIDEKGRNLSQGERQLLCIARCLLQESPVVVMDEATSSVDPQSEEILIKATEEFFKSKTQIIVAHRLSTLINCDRILWLQQGEIRMIGTPSEVLPVFQKSKL